MTTHLQPHPTIIKRSLLKIDNRFAPWVRGSKIKDLEFIKEYYGYSNEKAKVALQILSNDQIKTIKDSLSKGGRK